MNFDVEIEQELLWKLEMQNYLKDILDDTNMAVNVEIDGENVTVPLDLLIDTMQKF